MMMSMDKKYFIKTLVSEEVEQLHLILKQYHQVFTALGWTDRLTDRQTDTLINRQDKFRLIDRQIDRPTNRKTDKKTNADR